MQLLQEFNKSRDWAALHAADNSCFHYHERLLLKILDCASGKQHSDVCSEPQLQDLWKKELDSVETLIGLYVGRGALWLHRQFLSLCWIKHFYNNFSCCPRNITDIEIFMDNEREFCYSCSVIPDNEFEDYQAQATFSAVYIMWLVMQVAAPLRIEYQKKLDTWGLKRVLNNCGPEKIILWDTLTARILPRTSPV